MKCIFCFDAEEGPDHEISENHLKNKALYEYSENRQLFAKNRKGAVVSCNVNTSFLSLSHCADPRIEVSVKPGEEVKLHFTISNESKEEIYILYIQIPQNMLNFSMNDHSVGFGCAPVLLKPRRTFSKQIYVKFKSPLIGQYEMPILFSFARNAERFIIMRDMIVYVEEKEAIHIPVISPYAQKEVMAKRLVKTTIRCNRENLFRIPKNCKPMYASALKLRKDAPWEHKALAADIKEIFSSGITKENYKRFFHHLLWYEETIVRINLKKYNMSGVQLILLQDDDLGLFVPGLGEKRPSLMLGDLLFVKPQQTDEVMFEAVISEIKENYIIIRGLDDQFWEYHSPKARFDVRFFMSRMMLERMHQAVDAAMTYGLQCRVFPKGNCGVVQPQPIKNYFNRLVQANEEQRLAVEHIVAGTMGTAPYLVHGPPGTGKTVTIVEAILQIVAQSHHNHVMVCTDSNMAADHVAMMLLKYVHMFPIKKLFLRASSKYREWKTLPTCLYGYSNGTNYLTFKPVSAGEFISFKIVITTLSHAAKFARQFKVMKRERPITHLFIDEAAQASEPACLIPACGLLAPTGQLVLAGDPQQLGPVIISHDAKALGLGLSFMERLKNTNELYSDERRDPRYVVMLRNNFRSHADILDIPNALFYKGQLRALAAEDKLSSTDILGHQASSRAIVFHGVLSTEQRMGMSPSYYNIMELEIVQLYIHFLMKDHGVLQEDIGIVTPYIRQVYKINAWLQKNNLDRLEVGTVEAFQGKEKRVVVISTVRARAALLDHDARFRLGFLVDDKRFNVALTRAKAKVIVIGNPLCLEKDSKWRAYIQRCRDLGTYCGFDSESVRVDATRQDLLDRVGPALGNLQLANDKEMKERKPKTCKKTNIATTSKTDTKSEIEVKSKTDTKAETKMKSKTDMKNQPGVKCETEKN